MGGGSSSHLSLSTDKGKTVWGRFSREEILGKLGFAPSLSFPLQIGDGEGAKARFLSAAKPSEDCPMLFFFFCCWGGETISNHPCTIFGM